MNNIWTIIKKELTRVFTDKRMILSLFLIPPITIFAIYGLMGIAAENETTKIEEHQSIVYVINSPEEILVDSDSVISFENFLNSTLTNQKVSYYSNVSEEDLINYQDEVNNQNVDIIIEFPQDFESEIIDYKNVDSIPEVLTYYNINSNYSKSTYYNLADSISQYKELLLGLRVDLEDLKVLQIRDVELGDVEKAKGQGLSMIIPMLLVIYLMAGAMGVGIESVAGEKERGTIATLLVTPIKRSQLAIGKIISIAVIAVLSALSSFLGLVAVLPTFSKISGDTNAFESAHYQLIDFIMLLTIMLVAVLLFVGLIVIVSAYAKSVKEASTLVLPIYIIVLGASMYNMFAMEPSQAISFYLIPIYNIILALKAVFTFDLSITNWVATLGSTLVHTGILIFLIQKMFRSENIMFNK